MKRLQSMTVLGFMPLSEIHWQLLMGDGAMTFQPVEDDDNSATARRSPPSHQTLDAAVTFSPVT